MLIKGAKGKTFRSKLMFVFRHAKIYIQFTKNSRLEVLLLNIEYFAGVFFGYCIEIIWKLINFSW